MHDALGQFVLYHDVLKELQPDRRLFLAVRDTVFASVFEVPIGQLLLRNDRELVERILTDYASISYPMSDALHTQTVFDRTHDRYVLMNVVGNRLLVVRNGFTTPDSNRSHRWEVLDSA